MRVGALARHARVERSPVTAQQCPALAQALRFVAHPAVKNRGTVCGALAHADPSSELSRQWDEEHDRHVLRRLLDLIAPQFEPSTLAAFRRVAYDGVAPAQAAQELGLSLNAVLLAKSRVLSRLRQEAAGLID